jgi:hypothetical protein
MCHTACDPFRTKNPYHLHLNHIIGPGPPNLTYTRLSVQQPERYPSNLSDLASARGNLSLQGAHAWPGGPAGYQRRASNCHVGLRKSVGSPTARDFIARGVYCHVETASPLTPGMHEGRQVRCQPGGQMQSEARDCVCNGKHTPNHKGDPRLTTSGYPAPTTQFPAGQVKNLDHKR